MANPAPTINQINAFNATQGTTIDFNIIGGTELIRSNRIYIYDLSDNSLICTHLYVSTESIHELPANTDGSIVYESGKSSADFVNGAQYYAQIQTYTDTNGTQGGSGLSVAKMFWCLGDPTLTITTIPSTISTTSYNISATYTDTSASVVSNIIQQYQFNLYSATGSLLQSSGVVVGSGTQQGTSVVYDISHNFTGLNVGSSYYVTVDVTTTQGMSVTTQSNTFTVSIDTPTLGEATVVNNACDGYISVTSNLSGEYGGSGSGEIVSFETDSENVFSKLQVDLEPIQEGSGTPSPSNVRPIRGHGGADVNVVGKNLFDANTSPSIVAFTNQGDGVYYATLNKIGDVLKTKLWVNDGNYTGQICLSYKTKKTADSSTYPNNSSIIPRFYYTDGTNNYGAVKSGSDWVSIAVKSTAGKIVDYIGWMDAFGGDMYIKDIQLELGTTATPYEPYQKQTITQDFNVSLTPTSTDTTPYSFKAVGDVYGDRLEDKIVGGTVAWNQLVKELNATNWVAERGATISFEDDVIVVSSTTANNGAISVTHPTFKNGHKYLVASKVKTETDLDYVVVGAAQHSGVTKETSIQAGQWVDNSYVAQSVVDGTVPLYCYARRIQYSNLRVKDFMIIDLTQMFGSTIADYIYSLEQSQAGAGVAWFKKLFPNDYYAYNAGELLSVEGLSAHVMRDADNNVIGNYPLDSSLTLRGIPKLDASKNLYYDGDEYTSDGEVKRKYGIVDLGTLSWSNYKTGGFRTGTVTNAVSNTTETSGAICEKYNRRSSAVTLSSGEFCLAGKAIYIVDSSFTTDATAFKSAMSGVMLVYELATPTTETAQAYTNPQIVSKYGTLEYVTNSIVPVGHKTTYLTRDIFGGYVDLISGTLVVDKVMVTLDGSNDESWYINASGTHLRGYTYALSDIKSHVSNIRPTSAICDKIKTGTWNDVFDGVFVFGQTGKAIGFGLDSLGITDSVELKTWLSNNPITICYELATPQTYQLTPQQVNTLVGTNNVWSEQGNIELSYHIPITNLLVKRQDVDDVSGGWLTLYSQPITQASDMDFTFIDFLNQYGKTYKYALVPLLTQTQSGVEVEVEGGYTVSDEVQSVFDGVFIADSTGSQKCKANVGYGNVDMNQVVGSITPIGAKYPIIITNSHNQYHNGSISGTIVPDDYYFNGNLSRIDMVNKRNELEQFLTNKRVKVIKDWNGNIWLVMIAGNVSCTFNNNYGMGIVNFSTNWTEVGDPTNQQDLQATGLINIGGV